MRKSMGRKVLAVLMTAGLLLCTQSMTAAAGTLGIGSAAKPQGGPGAAMEQARQEEEQTAPEQGETQPEAQEEGTQPSLAIQYDVFFAQKGWSSHMEDNTPSIAGSGSWATAFKANLNHIPADAQIGVRYQVNLSGSGWLDWAADGAETGTTSDEMPLEAMRMELTGSSASAYDLYYKVLQKGSWTEWAVNGETAGTEGAGLRVDGIRASITPRGAGAPSASGETVDPNRPMLALTFDDGPKTSVTSRILDCLQAYGGRATFFMVGRNVGANAGVVQRMTAQGCQVANHTYDHKYISHLSAEGIQNQVGATNQAIAAACGVSPVVMRPPGGYIDAASLSTLGSMGMPAILWSIDTRDWQHRNAQRTINTVLSQVRDGDIILMHDIYAPTADAAEVLIPELTARGYQLVTVSELAANRGGLLPGHKYSQFWR